MPLATPTSRVISPLADKNAVVQTDSYGYRRMSAMESPEIWFEDFGSAELSNGHASRAGSGVPGDGRDRREQPMKVFVTMNEDSAGVHVVKGADRFAVVENNGGWSNAAFDYRVVAQAAGLRGGPLRRGPGPQPNPPPPVQQP